MDELDRFLEENARAYYAPSLDMNFEHIEAKDSIAKARYLSNTKSERQTMMNDGVVMFILDFLKLSEGQSLTMKVEGSILNMTLSKWNFEVFQQLPTENATKEIIHERLSNMNRQLNDLLLKTLKK